MSEKTRIICVVGPTASGKTELAVKIAQNIGGEVISADSMQIYKEMHIASAAPDFEEMGGVPHHLLEFLDYKSAFSVADYVALARKKIAEISSRGKMPVVVGGTGLYINSLVDNIEFAEQKSDPALREKLTEEFNRLGGKAMLDRLSQIDPDAAQKLHENDKRRIIRAFEIYQSTGLTKSQNNIVSRKNGEVYDAVMIGITYADRQKLYDRINLRVDKMLEKGILQEAKGAFINSEDNSTAGAIQAIGHKEFFPYFRGESSLEECVEALKQSSRRYAKRQLTWFNRDTRINWIQKDIAPDVVSAALKIIKTEERLCENTQ